MTSEQIEKTPINTREAEWVINLAEALLKSKIRPNQISLAGIMSAILAGVFFFFSRFLSWSILYLFAAVFILVRLLCNLMDRAVAARTAEKPKFRDMFNELPDRLEDIIIFAYAGFAAGNQSLGWCAATLAVLTAYIRLLGVSLGTKQYFCGPMARTQRMVVLSIVCLLELFLRGDGWSITIGLYAIVLGAFITCIRRAVLIAREIKKK